MQRGPQFEKGQYLTSINTPLICLQQKSQKKDARKFHGRKKNDNNNPSAQIFIRHIASIKGIYLKKKQPERISKSIEFNIIIIGCNSYV